MVSKKANNVKIITIKELKKCEISIKNLPSTNDDQVQVLEVFTELGMQQFGAGMNQVRESSDGVGDLDPTVSVGATGT